MRLFGRRSRTVAAADYPDAVAHLAEAIESIPSEVPDGSTWQWKPSDSESARRVMDLERDLQPLAVLALLRAAAAADSSADRSRGAGEVYVVPAGVDTARNAYNKVAGQMLRRKLDWSEELLADALDALFDQTTPFGLTTWNTPTLGLIGVVEKTAGGTDPPKSIAQRLDRLRRLLRESDYSDANDKRAARRIDVLLGEGEREERVLGDDPWARSVARAAESHPDELAGAVLRLAARARSASIPQRFIAEAQALVEDHGGAVEALVADLLAAAAAERGTEDMAQVPPETGDLLRGLAWIGSATGGERAARAMADLAIAGWEKVPNYGPRAAKAANGALTGLARMPAGAAQLGRVRVFLKQAQAVAKVEEAIDQAAEALDVPRDQFVERVVPEMGLEAGARTIVLGEHEAELRLHPDASTTLTFRTEAGKALKTVPAAVRSGHAEELRALRRETKDVKAMAGAQRARIERMLTDERDWAVADWRRYYWDHGLVGPLVRRVIWEIDSGGGWRSFVEHDGRTVGADGEQVEVEAGADARVRLWHPAAASVDEVRRWREALERLEIRQPFKQAHREIYVLTDAERETRTYSNRFAAHVVKQHQMSALCRARGWRYKLQGAWDSPDEEATLDLPQHGLRAAFWVERPWDQVGDAWAEAVSESGVFVVVTTDQVRFLDVAQGEPVDLEAVPPRAFSEVMRDVDLFVGVCSIGNDPTWVGQTEARPFGTYWESFAFGELGAQAETRREVLERLLPKLALADVARIDGRFLRVEGRLRTYRIHLGSTNILMEPNDEYLCIVRGRDKRAKNVFLPFEGDDGLALVLSKAFLLATDDEIDDPVITNQIRPRG